MGCGLDSEMAAPHQGVGVIPETMCSPGEATQPRHDASGAAARLLMPLPGCLPARGLTVATTHARPGQAARCNSLDDISTLD